MVAGVTLLAAASSAQTFTCGAGPNALLSSTRYGASAAGFDLAPSPVVAEGACTSTTPFFLSFPAAEGTYRVTVELGGPSAATTAVYAEARRLMALAVKTNAGSHRREVFLVNVRRPQIASGGEVGLKPRELRSLDWDSKLTLGFAGDRPSLRSVRIEPLQKGFVTVFLAGDSTVVDQENEPWAAWGQILPAFFKPGVSVENLAESGETIASFESEHRFAKIFSQIRPGDYLFVQFAHNDQKPGKGNVSPEAYAADLRRWIAEARRHGATPVLVTSMNRRTFADGHVTDSLAPYPETMRSVAVSEHVELIDLNAMSKTLYEAIGEASSRELFVYAPANTYPNQSEALHDDTHFNDFGALELARCVALGITRSDLPLRHALRSGANDFDPSHPDAPGPTGVPPLPFVDTETPYER